MEGRPTALPILPSCHLREGIFIFYHKEVIPLGSH